MCVSAVNDGFDCSVSGSSEEINMSPKPKMEKRTTIRLRTDPKIIRSKMWSPKHRNNTNTVNSMMLHQLTSS